MENREVKTKAKNKTKKNGEYLYKIIIVQFLACAFLTLLLAIVCRLGGGQSISEKYNSIMSADFSVAQIWHSFKQAAEFVFKPVDVNNIQEVTVPKENTEDEAENDLPESQTKPDTVEEPKEAPENSPTNKVSDDNTAQVMAFFSDSKGITAPVHGRISSTYGYRTDPISGEYAFHSALDIAVKEGTRVAAAWDGVVTQTGQSEKKGNFVWMVHKNGMETLYCHCSQILVKKGDVIRAGESVALSGNTGYSTGPHLHFGIRKNGEMLDPLDYLKEKDGYI